MLSLVLPLLFSIVIHAMPIIDLGINADSSGWDIVPSVVSSIVPFSPALNPLPTPVFQQQPIVTYLPQPQPIPQPSTNYDLGVAQVPQYQQPQYQVPQVQVPIQVPQVQVPIQVPQYQVPQSQVSIVPQSTQTETIPPPIVFPNGD